jgi:hypothetical protein
MKRNIYLASVLVLVISLVSLTAAFAQEGQETLLRVEVRNHTDQPVSLSLTGREIHSTYLLNVAPGSSRIYTLRAGMYDQTSYACGSSASGTLDVTSQLRLTFTPCFGDAVNQGAPTIEKVHLTDSPTGIKWRYQYGPKPLPGGGSTSGGGTASGPCQLEAVDEVTIYNRPSTASSVFSTQGPGFSQDFQARTSDGWLGFDPGVAQAANIGSFRLRWVEPGTPGLTGNCAGLPVVWGPPPGVCFDMPMDTTNVYTDPDATSPVVAVLHVGDFAAIVGLDPSGDWARVDLGPGNTGSPAKGWVEANSLNVNGPCDSLPTVTP